MTCCVGCTGWASNCRVCTCGGVLVARVMAFWTAGFALSGVGGFLIAGFTHVGGMLVARVVGFWTAGFALSGVG